MTYSCSDVILDNWLVNLTGHVDGFKEVDLLQEHQNFWAKIVYNAKGSNKSWKWLSMVTVCIWTLRDAMHTVHKTFQILAYGTKHTSPAINDEIAAIAQALDKERMFHPLSCSLNTDDWESGKCFLDHTQDPGSIPVPVDPIHVVPD